MFCAEQGELNLGSRWGTAENIHWGLGHTVVVCHEKYYPKRKWIVIYHDGQQLLESWSGEFKRMILKSWSGPEFSRVLNGGLFAHFESVSTLCLFPRTIKHNKIIRITTRMTPGELQTYRHQTVQFNLDFTWQQFRKSDAYGTISMIQYTGNRNPDTISFRSVLNPQDEKSFSIRKITKEGHDIVSALCLKDHASHKRYFLLTKQMGNQHEFGMFQLIQEKANYIAAKLQFDGMPSRMKHCDINKQVVIFKVTADVDKICIVSHEVFRELGQLFFTPTQHSFGTTSCIADRFVTFKRESSYNPSDRHQSKQKYRIQQGMGCCFNCSIESLSLFLLLEWREDWEEDLLEDIIQSLSYDYQLFNKTYQIAKE